MNEQQKEFLQFLTLLENNNVLDHVIILGSWAEFIYANSEILPDYPLTLRTLDVDFLVKNVRRPTTPVNLTTLAIENGYDFAKDVMYGTTKIITPGGMEIEFLIAQKGSGIEPVLKTNLGVNAQALRHMEMLINNTVSTNFVGLNVHVPCPESYVLHKMVINKERESAKKVKDAQAIVNLLPYVNMEILTTIFKGLTKKEKAEVRTFIELDNKSLPHEIPLAAKVRFAELKTKTSPDPPASKEKNLELQ